MLASEPRLAEVVVLPNAALPFVLPAASGSSDTSISAAAAPQCYRGPAIPAAVCTMIPSTSSPSTSAAVSIRQQQDLESHVSFSCFRHNTLGDHAALTDDDALPTPPPPFLKKDFNKLFAASEEVQDDNDNNELHQASDDGVGHVATCQQMLPLLAIRKAAAAAVGAIEYSASSKEVTRIPSPTSSQNQHADEHECDLEPRLFECRSTKTTVSSVPCSSAFLDGQPQGSMAREQQTGSRRRVIDVVESSSSSQAAAAAASPESGGTSCSQQQQQQQQKHQVLPLFTTPPPRPALFLKPALRRSSYSRKLQRGQQERCRTTSTPTSGGGGGSSEKKHVRGLWQEDARTNPFALLHDSVLLSIFSKQYLGMEDICRCQGVSRRWRTLASREEVWRHIDATVFVHSAFDHFATAARENDAVNYHPAEETTLALSAKLQSHAPVSLTIRCATMEADSFSMPSMKRLQSLTLTGFSDLTDTHLHVLFLSARTAAACAATGPGRIHHRLTCRTAVLPLAVLKLQDCPQLTNACLLSIALHCDHLQELSLRGCQQIDDLTALQGLWKRGAARCDNDISPMQRPPRSESCGGMSELFDPPPPVSASGRTCLGSLLSAAPAVVASDAPSATATTPPRPSGLAALFAPPPLLPQRTAAGHLATLFAPPPPPPSPPTSSIKRENDASAAVVAVPTNLGSLFSPPPRSSSAISSMGASISRSLPSVTHGGVFQQSKVAGKKLCKIDCSYSGVTGESLVRSLLCASVGSRGSTMLQLDSIVLRGNGESLNDSHMEELAELIDSSELCRFDISCDGANGITDTGLQALFLGGRWDGNHRRCLQLQQLCLGGHRSLTRLGIAKVVSASTTSTEVDLIW